MKAAFSVTSLKIALVLLITATLVSACGRQKKRYFAQVTPLLEQNEAVDGRVAKLPKINAFKDPDFLTKLDGYVSSKQKILTELETIKPPFLLSTTHAKLLQAMENGIRYLQSEREKFLIAAEKMSQNPASSGEPIEMEIIREYQAQSAAYQADMKEQLMKQQYQKLYYEAKDELERAKKF
ncbi:MAG: hypothetical protein C4520_17145 [Candidatus Abyssobacteria bacterium SURF_5]|uniref:Lipoprotein n=1 Tax=Abyssobacteria bacterium (strain SURF_5) TaxID=2093360 RepID=A0A3A4N5U8_ABYX5|nr:MAG: hypothetical protein C4520_17145 [Candidatus Abyssubacteria bacterium SURF_5]